MSYFNAEPIVIAIQWNNEPPKHWQAFYVVSLTGDSMYFVERLAMHSILESARQHGKINVFSTYGGTFDVRADRSRNFMLNPIPVHISEGCETGLYTCYDLVPLTRSIMPTAKKVGIPAGIVNHAALGADITPFCVDIASGYRVEGTFIKDEVVTMSDGTKGQKVRLKHDVTYLTYLDEDGNWELLDVIPEPQVVVLT